MPRFVNARFANISIAELYRKMGTNANAVANIYVNRVNFESFKEADHADIIEIYTCK